jgi:hypothetical protein
MKLEQQTSAILTRIMSNHWHATRHEDLMTQGIPDRSFGARGVQGWIELKALPTWPKRKDSPVSIHHYTQEQKAWLFGRGRQGARCWLLVVVKETNTWMLFNWIVAQEVGGLTRLQMLERADYVCQGGNPTPNEFLDVICGA